jgi:hypothetical protein
MKQVANFIKKIFKRKQDPISNMDHLNHLAFYKSKVPHLEKRIEELKTKVWVDETNPTPKQEMQDKWDTINWSRVSVETKNQIIELAKQDILNQLNSK